MQISNHSIHAWIQEHQIKTETGVPIDFYDHLFMYDVYRDWSPNLVCLKAAQVTFSTMAIIKTLWLAKNKGMDIIYTLPSGSDIKDFVGAKVNRIIAQNPVLEEYVKDRDTVEQKRVGDQIIYYRGTWTSRDAIAVSADLTVFDEVDRSNMPVVEQYASRLQHSQWAWQWYFSNPSYEGAGVDIKWQMSDKKHWFNKCEHCGFEQYLSFPDSIDMKNGIFVCKKCGKEISREVRRIGRWRTKKTDYKPSFSGYWINLLMCPWVSAEEIIEKYNTKDAEFFDNFVLGLPHVGGDNKLAQNDLLQNITGNIPDMASKVMIGVDTGLGIHLVAGNDDGLFYYSSTDDYNDFERLMRMYPNAIAVFDAHGDLQKPRELLEKYRNRMFLCYYQQDRKTSELIRWGSLKESDTVRVDRNRMIQLVVDEFRSNRIALHGGEKEWWDYWIHWSNIYRKEVDTSLGTKKRTWERSGADHLVHATVYWRTAMDRFGAMGKTDIFSKRSFLNNIPTGYNIVDGQTVFQKPQTKQNYGEYGTRDFK